MDLWKSLLPLTCIAAVVNAGVEVGYSNIKQDTIAGETVVEYGEVPRWIEGSYIRQSCGAFGETGSNLDIVNKVEHLFDCIEMGQSYRFKDGQVTFYNRFFDTAIMDLYKAYGMNMNDSRVFWNTAFAAFDYEQQQRLQPIIDNSNKIFAVPQVTFWRMGENVYAHSEYPALVQIDPHEVTNSISYHQFDDDNFGYTNEIILDEQAHEAEDPDGTLYCSHMVYRFNPHTFTVQQWKNVFMIRDNVRSTVARIPYPDLDLTLCGDSSYPILMHRQGYVHSFAMTENYIILPESSYLLDICSVIVNQRPDLPDFPKLYDWEGDVPSRVWVIRKSDGHIMASINTTAVFITHQLNAYEEGDLIHADMTAFADQSPYSEYTFVENLIDAKRQGNDIARYTINTADWTVTRRNLVEGPLSAEFPAINFNYAHQPYSYAYLWFGIYSNGPQSLGKVNVRTGEVTEYVLPDGFYGLEPIFLQEPGTTGEDEGVVMLSSVDTVRERGFLMIFDARDMSLVAHLTGSDLVLFGIHAKFYPGHIGNMDHPVPPTCEPPVPPASAATMNFIFYVLPLCLVMLLLIVQ